VDSKGLSALSMRRLGASLGVDAMAIYYYLPNKAALYDALVEAVMKEIDISQGNNDGTPLKRLKAMAYAYKDALLAHPNALPVIAARPIRTPSALRPIERMLGILLDYGLSPSMAMAVVNNCAHYILGAVQSYVPHLMNMPLHDHDALDMQDLSPEKFPNLRKVTTISGSRHPFEMEFEVGLEAFLIGSLSMPQSSVR
jgi:AcrR family transcriptional regulator